MNGSDPTDQRVNIPKYPNEVSIYCIRAHGGAGGYSVEAFAVFDTVETVVAFYEDALGSAGRDPQTGKASWNFEDNYLNLVGRKSLSIHSASPLPSILSQSRIPDGAQTIIWRESSHREPVASSSFNLFRFFRDFFRR